MSLSALSSFMRAHREEAHAASRQCLLFFTLCFLSSASVQCITAVLPPVPVLPIPTASQLEWQQRERLVFLHFGVNTFSGNEQGNGSFPASYFDPEGLNATQWADVVAKSGFKEIILVARHRDGFCLWPSSYTNYSVAASPWKQGEGDVVAEAAAAARAAGLAFGLYLSPSDVHDPRYSTPIYTEFYLAQLRELYNRYGRLDELWLDGGGGMYFDPSPVYALEKQLSPESIVFSGLGPGCRWVGNEDGSCGETCWSMVSMENLDIYGSHLSYLNSGDVNGSLWMAPECDVSIRNNWFWHEEDEPKSVEELVNIYFASVGRNCVLLLNVPPNQQGLLDATDVERLIELEAVINATFATNLAVGATASASSYRGASVTGLPSAYAPALVLSAGADSFWAAEEDSGLPQFVELILPHPQEFDVVSIMEPIAYGQRVSLHSVEAREGDKWRTILNGTTIGYKRLHRLEVIERADAVRLVIQAARAEPLIASFGLYKMATNATMTAKMSAMGFSEVVVEDANKGWEKFPRPHLLLRGSSVPRLNT